MTLSLLALFPSTVYFSFHRTITIPSSNTSILFPVLSYLPLANTQHLYLFLQSFPQSPLNKTAQLKQNKLPRQKILPLLPIIYPPRQFFWLTLVIDMFFLSLELKENSSDCILGDKLGLNRSRSSSVTINIQGSASTSLLPSKSQPLFTLAIGQRASSRSAW